MDSARWKNDSVSLKAYLTAWYYPLRNASEEEHANDQPGGIHGEAGMTVGGSRPTTRSQRPYSTGNPNEGTDYPSASNSTLSNYRIKMKDVDSVPLDKGGTAITSSRSNLKLDKTTTYILAAGDLPETK